MGTDVTAVRPTAPASSARRAPFSHVKACPPQVHAIFDAIVAFGKTGTRSAVSAVSAVTDEP